MSIKCKHVTCQCDDPKDATIARLTRELDEARRDLQFYKDREAHYARVLGVDDGGRFRADWDGAIDRLVRRATAAEARVRELEERIAAREESQE